MCTYKGQRVLAWLISLTSFLSIYPFTLSVPRICQAQCCLRASVFIPSSREAPAAVSQLTPHCLCPIALSSLERPLLIQGKAALSLPYGIPWHHLLGVLSCTIVVSHCLIPVYTPHKNISSVTARTGLLDSLLYTLLLVRSRYFGSIFNFLFYIEVYPFNNVVMVSGGQQRDSAIYTHVYIHICIHTVGWIVGSWWDLFFFFNK